MLSSLKVLFLLLFSMSAYADVFDSAQKFVSESEKQAKHYLLDAQGLQQKAQIATNQLLESGKGCSLVCIKPNESTEETETEIATKKENKEPILVFISFSMPKESLKSLFMEAEQQNVQFVLRGLKNNSFKETAEILKDLKTSVNIDPNLFDKHKIVAVPTFVYLKEDEELILHGNVSLAYAREKFKGEQ